MSAPCHILVAQAENEEQRKAKKMSKEFVAATAASSDSLDLKYLRPYDALVKLEIHFLAPYSSHTV